MKKSMHLGLSIVTSLVLLGGGSFGLLQIHKSFQNEVVNGISSLGSIKPAKAESALPTDLKSLIHEVQKEVVQLQVKEADGEAIGSGFLYNDKGDIITNAHVVGDAKEVTVKLSDSSLYPGTVIGKSSDLDVALVRVPNLAGKTPLKLNKDKKGDTGDDVIAFGSPLGLDNTVTTGIVSGVGRDFTIGPYKYKNLYQISAPIAHGNSGGPLLLKKTGEVIGVNSAGASEGNIGFSIPIDQVIPLVESWSSNPSASVATAPSADAQLADKVQSDPKSFSNSAEYLVRYFYESLNSQDYVTAYSLLGSGWKSKTPYDGFRSGFLDTVSVSIKNLQASPPSDDRVSVTALIEAVERTAQGDKVINDYEVSYQIGFENNQVRLISGKVKKL